MSDGEWQLKIVVMFWKEIQLAFAYSFSWITYQIRWFYYCWRYTCKFNQISCSKINVMNSVLNSSERWYPPRIIGAHLDTYVNVASVACHYWSIHNTRVSCQKGPICIYIYIYRTIIVVQVIDFTSVLYQNPWYEFPFMSVSSISTSATLWWKPTSQCQPLWSLWMNVSTCDITP